MRAIVHTGDGVVELNYLWLPTVIGMNASLKQLMEKALKEELKLIPLDEAGLDRAHDIVVKYLLDKFPSVRGLDKYLDGMRYLEL